MTIIETNKEKRVRLIHTDDPYTKLKSGDKGTYEYTSIEPELIQHFIKWDNGSNLILLKNDRFEFIDEETDNEK